MVHSYYVSRRYSTPSTKKKPVLPQIDSIRQTQNAFHQRKWLSKHACSQNDFRSSITVYHTCSRGPKLQSGLSAGMDLTNSIQRWPNRP